MLTIKSVLKTHTINDDGYVVGTGDEAGNGMNAGGALIYMAANNKSVNDVADDTANMQWTLTDGYKSGSANLVLTESDNDDVTYAIDRNTVAFYYNVTDGEVSYGVSTGWQNMGTINGQASVQVYPVQAKNSDKELEPTKLAEVVLFNATSVATSRDYLFVLNRNAYTAADELWLNVVFEDGTTKEVELSTDSAYYTNLDEDDNYYGCAYAYVENSDGTYTLVNGTRIEAEKASLLKVGTVDGDAYYALPDSAKVWDVSDMASAADEPAASTFNYVDVWAVIVPTTDENTVIRTAFIWDIVDEKPVIPEATYTLNSWVGSEKGNVQVTIAKDGVWMTRDDLRALNLSDEDFTLTVDGIEYAPTVEEGYPLTIKYLNFKDFHEGRDSGLQDALIAANAGFLKIHFPAGSVYYGCEATLTIKSLGTVDIEVATSSS